jgi:hypothetical protein
MQNEGGDDLTVFELDADRASFPREAASRVCLVVRAGFGLANAFEAV